MSLTNLQQKQWYYITQLQLTANSLLVGHGSDLRINGGNRACLSSSLPRDTEQRFLQFAEPEKRQPGTMSSICDMMSQIGNQLGHQPPHFVDQVLLNRGVKTSDKIHRTRPPEPVAEVACCQRERSLFLEFVLTGGLGRNRFGSSNSCRCFRTISISTSKVWAEDSGYISEYDGFTS